VTIKQRILHRKIGAFEVLTLAVLLETLTGRFLHALAYAALAAAFAFAKNEFKGEFSLEELIALLSDNEETKPKDNTK
jgi:hypothetical protein